MGFRRSLVPNPITGSVPEQSGVLQSVEYLHYPGPADAEVTGKGSTVPELAGVEQRLIVPGELERIARFLRRAGSLQFGVAETVPGKQGDDGPSM
jgi:hypothetical protein